MRKFANCYFLQYKWYFYSTNAIFTVQMLFFWSAIQFFWFAVQIYFLVCSSRSSGDGIKKRIPLGLKDIITERVGRQLRNRQFIRERTWRQDSVAYRLATRTKTELNEIEVARSKKGLTSAFWLTMHSRTE